jgi:pimeloyl-ACP methyl ester carboxylesterase
MNAIAPHRVFGYGPIKVLAFHGWFGHAGDWAAMEPALDPTLLTLVAMDQRGYGQAMGVEGQFTVDEVAQDGLALADHLGWRRFHLLGHSMSGKVVQRVMAQAAARVQSAVALTPVPASGAPFDEATYGFFESAAASDAVRAGIVSHSVSDRLSAAWVAHTVTRSRAGSTQAAFARYLPSWAREDFSDAVKGLSTPLLVLIGEHDPALGRALMEATFMQHYPQAVLETINNSGHYPMWEATLDTATRIQALFTRHRG